MTIIFRYFLYINLFLLVNFNLVFARTNDGTTGVYGSTDTNFTLSNNETFINNGSIYGFRKSINVRQRSGTTLLNNENALIEISGSAAVTHEELLLKLVSPRIIITYIIMEQSKLEPKQSKMIIHITIY